ncbi:MAG: metalloregulator ArsR/SmtB family transcription factor [Bacteroidota bacterium]
MGLTKTENFTEEQNELADIARVLAHPARIAIIQYILKIKQCIGGEIVEEIPLAQPTISRHLKELKNIGVIQGTVEGKSVCYCVDHNRWNDIKGVFNKFFETK